MAKRSSSNQSIHDQAVRREAQNLKKEGWDVKADLPGFDLPNSIGKAEFVPDIEATKHGTKKIIEFETPDSLEADKKQHGSFRRSAAQRPRATFELKVAKPRKR